MDTELSKTELKILRFFTHDFIGLDRPHITVEVISSKFNLTIAMASHCLNNLVELNFAKIDTFYTETDTYKITSAGTLHLEKIKSKIHSKIIWSIVVPVAVSAITSFLITQLSF